MISNRIPNGIGFAISEALCNYYYAQGFFSINIVNLEDLFYNKSSKTGTADKSAGERWYDHDEKKSR